MEGDFLVHHVVDCSIDEESEELGEVFVQVEDFHHDQQSEKLGAVGTSESDQEKRDFTAEFTGTGRKYPVFAPEEVVDLRINRITRTIFLDCKTKCISCCFCSLKFDIPGQIYG